jgi:predicted nucleic acid-binding protein
MVCVDAGPVIHLVAFPDHVAVQDRWSQWDEKKQSIVAPSLLYYEVTNGLYRYQKQRFLSAVTVEIALQAALALPIELISDPQLHVRATLIASRFNLAAAYDAHYLALAEWLEVDLWTMDKRLVKALEPYQLAWLHLMD